MCDWIEIALKFLDDNNLLVNDLQKRKEYLLVIAECEAYKFEAATKRQEVFQWLSDS